MWHLPTLIYNSFSQHSSWSRSSWCAGISLRFNLAVEYCVSRKQSHLGLDALGQVVDIGEEQGRV